MKVGFLQTNPIFGNKKDNFKNIKDKIGNKKVDLLVLPELFATGYTFKSKKEVKSFSETKKDETAIFLKQISLKIEGTVIGGFIESEKNKIYNSSLIVYKGNVIDTYKKIHLFNKEKKWFNRGQKKPKVYNINGINIGVMICFDWLFPEISRGMALKGMQVLAHPSNLVLPYCQNAMITRSIENKIFSVTCNRIGSEIRGKNKNKFTGQSQITDPNGNILDKASNEVKLSIVNIDEKKANNKQINNHNNIFDDRQTYLY